MTDLMDHHEQPPPAERLDPPPPLRTGAGSRWRWNRLSPLQLLVVALATVAPLVVAGSIGAGLLGVASTEEMITVALAAGENPGMLTFGAMFLASPIQWLTGRSQIRVRKYLGMVFFLLALSNAAMFVVERGLPAMFGSAFLVAGSIAVGLAVPLFLTSSRWSQRLLGMRRWRLLHRLTYVIAVALLGHVVLIGDIGPGAVLIMLGFMARVPTVRRRLSRGRPDPRSARPATHRSPQAL